MEAHANDEPIRVMRRTHHLHLVPVNSPRYRGELAFRDRLRADPRAADEYAALKHDLARRFEYDREAYTAAKGDFVRRVLDTPHADVR